MASKLLNRIKIIRYNIRPFIRVGAFLFGDLMFKFSDLKKYIPNRLFVYWVIYTTPTVCMLCYQARMSVCAILGGALVWLIGLWALTPLAAFAAYNIIRKWAHND